MQKTQEDLPPKGHTRFRCTACEGWSPEERAHPEHGCLNCGGTGHERE